MPLLDTLLKRIVVLGRLTVIWPDGTATAYIGREPGPEARIRVHDRAAAARIALNPSLRFGEAWMDGTLTVEGGSLYEVLDLLMLNLERGGSHPVMTLLERVGTWLKRLQQSNPIARARHNVAHHYDLSGRLYSLFLDRDRQYSCAYFPRGDETLEEAQAAKKRHIAAKLLLTRPGLRVLDIGSGWGGLALTLAREWGADVTGITLSEEQHREASARAVAEGLSERVRFRLQDYREVAETYDRVVSVGMFEHVGIPHYDAFFRTVARCLAPDGVALIHAIGRPEGPGVTNAWLRKYIFPGGYSPALSEVLPAIERSRLLLTDLETLRLHYAETLRHWRERFLRNRDAIAAIYDERFCRMWEFYLVACELAFRHQGHFVWQAQLVHRQDVVPLTRDYIAEAEAAALRRAASPVSTGL
jgi:cyclopropane-fatty-acyl-phospholipid synthase